MRVICYKEGFKKPVIEHIDNLSSIGDIVGFQIRNDGKILLHTARTSKGNKPQNFVFVIPVGKFPGSMDEAIQERKKESMNDVTAGAFYSVEKKVKNESKEK